MSNFLIKKVAVLGAGVMGAQIAAHCINAKVPVILFDLPSPNGNKNEIIDRAIENLKKLNPAPLSIQDDAICIEAANYEEDLARLKECDLIIEAIAERIDYKHALYQKIAPFISENNILASNTSGLSITQLSSGLPDALKNRFCGVHFFNPPRYMHLVELIPAPNTHPIVLDQLEDFLTQTLGKGVIRAKDTPNFVANRIGVFSMLSTFIEAARFDLPIDVVDDLTGSKLGRAKSGTFRTADIVGLDTLNHVIKTMLDNLPNDPFKSIYTIPKVLEELVKQGALGQKSGAGFYKKQGREILMLDFNSKEYVASGAKMDPFIGRVLEEKNLLKQIEVLRNASNKEAQFLWAIYRNLFHYIAIHLESIAHSARDIDFAMRWGFGWTKGPFELWQQIGWLQIAKWVKEDIEQGKALCNTPLPDWVFDNALVNHQIHTEQGSYSAQDKKYIPLSNLPVYQRQLFRARVTGDNQNNPNTAGTTVFENESIRLWHQDDEILIASIKTKMHVLNSAVVSGLSHAIDVAEASFKGLVIWQTNAHEGGAFSAGADLKAMLPLFMSGGIPKIEDMVAAMQNTHQKIKYAQIPVVAAVSGLALGGGCELLMHCAKRVVHLESYIGLVEVGVGLIPAAGGLKEGASRAARAAKEEDIFPFLKNNFMHAALAEVSKSAGHAQQMGYILPSDTLVLNAHELLYIAKNEARNLYEAGYRPPLQKQIRVVGKYGIANILMQLVNLRDGGFISAYDYHLGATIAKVICGGEIEPNSQVSEQWLLDLERKAFMELLVHPKTQERVMGMMQNGKPVRN
jgi:3-hydroxyacyl-CoA dehydrogenase